MRSAVHSCQQIIGEVFWSQNNWQNRLWDINPPASISAMMEYVWVMMPTMTCWKVMRDKGLVSGFVRVPHKFHYLQSFQDYDLDINQIVDWAELPYPVHIRYEPMGSMPALGSVLGELLISSNVILTDPYHNFDVVKPKYLPRHYANQFWQKHPTVVEWLPL